MFRLLDINLHSKQRIKKTLMTEFEKMRNSELYAFSDAETMESINREVIEELIPGIPASTTVNPPFHCDHGNGIKLGENVFINYNCTMLDSGLITIGAHTLIGPNCQLVTPNHPIDYLQRRKTVETGYPITIGEDSWLGAAQAASW